METFKKFLFWMITIIGYLLIPLVLIKLWPIYFIWILPTIPTYFQLLVTISTIKIISERINEDKFWKTLMLSKKIEKYKKEAPEYELIFVKWMKILTGYCICCILLFYPFLIELLT